MTNLVNDNVTVVCYHTLSFTKFVMMSVAVSTMGCFLSSLQ